MSERLNYRYIALTILGSLTLIHTGALAVSPPPATQACIENLCREGSAGAERLKSFVARENVDHPDLAKTMAKYESSLDRVRESRATRMKVALAISGDKQWLETLLNKTSDAELLELFLHVRPWNNGRVTRGGRIEVTATPLAAEDTPKSRLIVTLFDRFMAASPLYKLQTEFSSLHTDFRKALGLSPKADLQTVLTNKIFARMSELSPAARADFNELFKRSLETIKTSQRVYGPDAAIYLAELELKLLIRSGSVSITPMERQTLLAVVSDQFNRFTNRASTPNLDQVFSKSIWDQKCRKAFNRTLQYGLSDKDAGKIKAIKKDAIQRATVSLREIFGSETTSKLKSFLETVDVVGPLSTKAYFKMSEVYMDQEIKAGPPKTAADVYGLLYDLRSTGDARVEQICNSFIYQPLRDQENKGLIILSSYSLEYPRVGISIATHEMGHAAMEGFTFLRDAGKNIDPFLKIRECLNTNYVHSNRGGPPFSSDKLWTEEDWADAFSGYSTRDLKAISDCTFLGAIPTHDYADLEQRDSDPHSPTFYRILNTAIHARSELPKQCTDAMGTEFPNLKFGACLSKRY